MTTAQTITTEAATGEPLPLAGVRVLSQGIVWAGPFGTLILADLGAEVIEIESIQHLNPTRATFRHVPPAIMQGVSGVFYLDRDPSEGFWNRQAFYNYAKRAHKSVTLDLHSEAGRELFFELVRQSDVFLENNAAGVVEHLGIDWPQLSEVNPRLVMVRFPGFGISGPYKYFRGYGATMEAVVGHTMLRGYRDADPSATPPIYHGDPNAGAHVAFAIQAALFARETTGAGQLIDMSQAEAVVHHTSYALMDYAMNRRVQRHWGNRHPSMAPYGVFPAAGEDRYVALAVPDDAAFARLCEAIGQPELASDARFADSVARYQHQDDLEPLVAEWTRTLMPREAMERLQAAGVPCAMVAKQDDEMATDPHLRERGFFITNDHPEVGTRRYPGPMAKFPRTPLGLRGPAPTLGQHNEDILCGLLGVSEERYRQLLEQQVIGTAYLETAT